jgi:hypothetical protein
MLGAIEAANGVLLFGLTTAFMFTVMQVLVADVYATFRFGLME